MRREKKLGEILIELQVLTPLDVERVLTAMRRRKDYTKFGAMARTLGLLREEHILAALAVQLRLIPGIQEFSLNRILASLQSPDSGPPPREGPAGPRLPSRRK
jgi:hypothetical protein